MLGQTRLTEGPEGILIPMHSKTATLTSSEVLEHALALDERDGASVAGALIGSLETRHDPGAEQAWDAEIRRRIEELDSGAAKTIPWSEVRRQLFGAFE